MLQLHKAAGYQQINQGMKIGLGGDKNVLLVEAQDDHGLDDENGESHPHAGSGILAYPSHGKLVKGHLVLVKMEPAYFIAGERRPPKQNGDDNQKEQDGGRFAACESY
jgi:hypothetical protein